MTILDIDSGNNTGGHPFWMNDLKSLQDGTFDTISSVGIVAGSAFTPMILGNLAIRETATTFDLSYPSMAWYNSRVWVINTAIGSPLSTVPGSAYKLKKNKVLANGDPVLYATGLPKEVHYIEFFTIEHTALAGPEYVPLTFFNVNGWIEETAVTQISNSTTTLKIRWKAIGHTLYIWCAIPAGSTAAQANYAYVQLPSLYKAKSDQVFVVQGGLIAGNQPAAICLKITAGDNKLYVTDLDGTTGNVPGGVEIAPTILTLETIM
jgi:hypothetical protein